MFKKIKEWIKKTQAKKIAKKQAGIEMAELLAKLEIERDLILQKKSELSAAKRAKVLALYERLTKETE